MAHQDVDIDFTVAGIRKETDEHMSVVFERPAGFAFESGDWVEFTFAPQMSGGPTYSLSSAPTEPELAITFRTGFSDIKRALGAATAGDRFNVNSFGNDYRFTLKESQPSVLIAGGVGIAPFRSMLKEMRDLGSANVVDVVYFNRGPTVLFAEELERFNDEIPGMSLGLVDTRELGRKAREQLLRTRVVAAGRQFFVAGPDTMVTSTRELLRAAGVADHDVRIDNFGTL